MMLSIRLSFLCWQTRHIFESTVYYTDVCLSVYCVKIREERTVFDSQILSRICYSWIKNLCYIGTFYYSKFTEWCSKYHTDKHTSHLNKCLTARQEQSMNGHISIPQVISWGPLGKRIICPVSLSGLNTKETIFFFLAMTCFTMDGLKFWLKCQSGICQL